VITFLCGMNVSTSFVVCYLFVFVVCLFLALFSVGRFYASPPCRFDGVCFAFRQCFACVRLAGSYFVLSRSCDLSGPGQGAIAWKPLCKMPTNMQLQGHTESLLGNFNSFYSVLARRSIFTSSNSFLSQPPSKTREPQLRTQLQQRFSIASR
jgi:hypothetical protein